MLERLRSSLSLGALAFGFSVGLGAADGVSSKIATASSVGSSDAYKSSVGVHERESIELVSVGVADRIASLVGVRM